MARAILVIDVQNDFCEGGALAVDGGAAVAARITKHLEAQGADYEFVIASRDWHEAGSSNGGHFALDQQPDFLETWPAHCVQGTPGAEYHPALNTEAIDIHVLKGQGVPAYSIFEGQTAVGEDFADLIQRLGITQVDVVGIATDYCVLASATDAHRAGLEVRVITGLTAGVDRVSTEAAVDQLIDLGIEVVA